MNTQARSLLLSVIKTPYAWPGGYERMIVTADGGLLCSDCCRKEARRIMGDVRDGYNTGWLPAATTYEAVSADCCRPDHEDLINYCDHCNKEVGELA